MKWNWQHPEWPEFSYDASALERHEAEFLKQGGILLGAFKHLKLAEETELLADAATSEALTTSAIEGEILDRESVRSSILRHLGLSSTWRQGNSREEGIARLMADLLLGWHRELTHERLWRWHEMLMQGRSSLTTIGAYRTHPRPMQIVSGPEGRQVVHFEAPPSERVPQEMDAFLDWFNGTERDLPPIARAGIAHLYFESIHPFEDGNGRIGRAISEVALAQGLGDRSLTMLATEIRSRQTDYYAALSSASRDLEVTGWLKWFAGVVLAAQRRTLTW
ncbi:MAG: Fic family protein, partial [Armatimonadetes bacterium]